MFRIKNIDLVLFFLENREVIVFDGDKISTLDVSEDFYGPGYGLIPTSIKIMIPSSAEQEVPYYYEKDDKHISLIEDNNDIAMTNNFGSLLYSPIKRMKVYFDDNESCIEFHFVHNDRAVKEPLNERVFMDEDGNLHISISYNDEFMNKLCPKYKGVLGR